MWQNKTFLTIGVLTAVTLTAILGGVAIAQADDESSTTTQCNETSLMEKVASIYESNTGTTLDPQELENAFVQAREEIRAERRYQCLDELVEQGKITQEQADQWKAWLETKPEVLTNEFKEWLDARPDIPVPGNKGGMMFGGRMNGSVMCFGGMQHGGNSEGLGLKSRICWSD